MDIGPAPERLSPVPDWSGASLGARYTDHDRPILISGVQALVRVLLEQRRLDRAAGLATAGLVSGYRGSPLGGLDQALWHEAKILAEHDIRFQPGLNEDLAATMLWGAQQLDAFPGALVQGVFGMWYGKGPGVDRSGDAFRCANMLGTSALGGVLAVSGDDHGAHSSTYPHQTDQSFQSLMMPLLHPGSAQDIIDLGLAGIALSRFCGLWVALKTTSETAEQHGSVIVPSTRAFATPAIAVPGHGFGFDPHLHFPADRAELERRVMVERLPAALAWARANRLDRQVLGGAGARIGIVTVGKAHADTLHALRRMDIDRHPEIAVYKIAMTWPLETEGLAEFAAGKDVLLVVEEKRSFVEAQIRDALYNLPADRRPLVAGKTDLAGAPLLSPLLELSPEQVMAALRRILGDFAIALSAEARAEPVPAPLPNVTPLARTPAFCAGCPHATSTKLPDGSFATAGIGCHFMALDDDPATRTFTHMGGEGVTWVGMAPFTGTPHMFANLGDGTYTHSGVLAIRQAIAAKARITYKILFNGAVAMTGGQPAEGGFDVPAIAAQMAAEGVRRIAVVADEASRLPRAGALPAGTTRDVRANLDDVQKSLRDYDGVSVLIYDQICATEQRRQRKRGLRPEAARSVVINQSVCENCGDCSTQSRCIAIEPVATKLGRKRRINPTACNVDLSCLKGFCPSFVTIAGAPRAPGADPRWQAREAALAEALPSPVIALRPGPWRALFAGIGGGGIVTTGAIVAMAAHLEGRSVSTLDFTGLAQKNGAVVSHVQVGTEDTLDVVRIPQASADLMLAADLVVAAGPAVLERCHAHSLVIGNLDLAATAAFRHDANLAIDAGLHRRLIARRTDGTGSAYLHAVRLAERLFGNAQAMNTLLLGIAFQLGAVPISEAALRRAIELNGVAVATNLRAFLWGRILAAQPGLAQQILADDTTEEDVPITLEGLIEARVAALTAYQNAAYATAYRARVQEISAREQALVGTAGSLTRAVAEGLFRVMAYKDEYEVARLHAEASYGPDPVFHLSPPLPLGRDPATGRRRKIALSGRYALPLFRALRHGKALRGTIFDPFGYQAERRGERAAIAAYQADLDAILTALTPATLATATELAALPDQVRGFGPVKEEAAARAEIRRVQLRESLSAPPAPVAVQAAE